MPELPEVETIRRGLRRRIVGKRIASVGVRKKKMVRNGKVKDLQRDLAGRKFGKIMRRGKLLALEVIGEGRWLLIHLKMTGQLIYRDDGGLVAGGHPSSLKLRRTSPRLGSVEGLILPDKYTHIIFTFDDGSRLFFNDQRQFGYLRVVGEEERKMIWETFGVEPISREWGWQGLRDVLRKRRVAVKAVLLDQAAVAGLGNIYVDEVLWRARVRPDRPADSLTAEEVKRVARSAREVLKKAIEVGGTTFSDYRNVEGAHGRFTKYLRVYDREGKKCRRCGSLVEKMRVAGRGTHYCAGCQA